MAAEWDQPTGEQSSSWDEPAGDQSTNWDGGVVAEEATIAEEVVGRQHGTVKRWTEKGFGFIERDNDPSDSVFCHNRDTPGRTGLVAGSKVSFDYEMGQKGANAKNVRVEEAAVEVEEIREFGTIKRWNAEKAFGFIGRASGGDDAFVHRKDCGDKDLSVGQYVSFVYAEGAKGAAAKKVREEEGGAERIEEAGPEEEEGERELGKVKQYNEEKGFAFIAPCQGGDDLFSHKREFGGIEPRAGQPVSFIRTTTDKGDAATKVREEESVPEPRLTDEGREFGKVKNFMAEKGFGFINWKGEEPAIAFDKQCNGLTLVKDMTVSFVFEEGPKGPLAKDIREEDPARVARVTAKRHYGKVERYSDPPYAESTNGYGFIEPLNPPGYGQPKKYYFHMSEIEDPDENGGIEPGTGVSFIVQPARSGRGFQACMVTVADPPAPEGEKPLEDGLEKMSVKENGATDAAAEADGGWGGFGDAPAPTQEVPVEETGWGSFGD